MRIVGGFDLHRAQITYDYIDTATGEVHGGRILPGDRAALAAFLADLPSTDAHFVVEGCCGWRFVAEELTAAGMVVHVADPAEAAALRGPKKRAKTDRADARHLRQLLVDDRVPESYVPPAHMLDTRSLGRLYADLLHTRAAWGQRVHATVFHLGCPPLGRDLAVPALQAKALEAAAGLPAADAHAIRVAVNQIQTLTSEMAVVHKQLVWFGNHQAGCRAIRVLYGVGELVAPVIWAELGDVRRFTSSRQAVRHTGLDITIHESDARRARGRLARQGPGQLRWALYEAGMRASHPAAPDHAYYMAKKAQSGHNIATMSVARKIIRRCFHILVALDDAAMAPPTSRTPRPALTRPMGAAA